MTNLLSIDGGQTSTKAMIATDDGRVIGEGLGGPTVHYYSEGGIEKNRASVRGAIKAALSDAGVDASSIVSVGFGCTGVDPHGEEGPVIHQILRELLKPRSIEIATDTYTNLMGASGGEPGIVVIAGGGAIGYGLTVDGRTAISNGFGYWLGDEGSAFWIGRRAIDVAIRASDGRGAATGLLPIVLAHFSVSSMRQIPRIVYRAGFDRTLVSFLAPQVAEAARRGDQTAAGIYATAAEELALTAVGVARQLYSAGDSVVVYPTGGVFSERELVRLPFDRHVMNFWPTAGVRSPLFPPGVGGLIVAARSAGLNVDENWLAQTRLSLNT